MNKLFFHIHRDDIISRLVDFMITVGKEKNCCRSNSFFLNSSKCYTFLSSKIVIVEEFKCVILFGSLFFKKNDHAGIFGLDYAFFDFRKSHFILRILEFKAVFHFFPVAAALFAFDNRLGVAVGF